MNLKLESEFFISAFGHTFLVAYNGDEPKADDIVIEYLADTSSEGYDPISALVARVPGRYNLSRFFYKFKQNDLENRDLVYYDVDTDKVDIEQIIQMILSSNEELDYYNFINRNCSYYIFRLLAGDKELTSVTIPVRTIAKLKEKSYIKFRKYIYSTQKNLEDVTCPHFQYQWIS